METRVKARNQRIAVKIAGGYAVAAGLWILFSDQAVGVLVRDPRAQLLANTAKGWVFVAVTATVLYVLLRRYLGEITIGEDALRASERRLERIFATIPSAVMIVDKNGNVTSANHAAERLLRKPAGWIAGRRYGDFEARMESLEGVPLPEDETPTVVAAATGEPVYDARFALVFPDGTRKVVAMNASPLLDENGDRIGVVSASLDVSDAYDAEQRLVHANRMYSMVSRANQAIVRIRDEEQLYLEACRITVEYGGFRMAWIGLLDREAGTVRPVAHAGAEDGYLDEIKVTLSEDDEGRGPVGTAARLGRTVVSNDIAHDPYMRPWVERALARGFHSLAAVPLKSEDLVFGVFAVYSAETGFFDAEETGMLEALAADIVFAASNIRHDGGGTGR